MKATRNVQHMTIANGSVFLLQGQTNATTRAVLMAANVSTTVFLCGSATALKDSQAILAKQV